MQQYIQCGNVSPVGKGSLKAEFQFDVTKPIPEACSYSAVKTHIYLQLLLKR